MGGAGEFWALVTDGEIIVDGDAQRFIVRW